MWLRHFLSAGLLLPLLMAGEAAEVPIQISGDRDFVLDSLTVVDHGVVQRGDTGTWSLALAPMTALLPPGADLDALGYRSESEVWFSLDVDVILSGQRYADEDLIFWNGSAFSMAWDGSLHGLPASTNLDAVHIVSTSPFTFDFSLDTDVILPVLGRVADEDVMQYAEGDGIWTVVCDGSGAGVAANADLDAFNRHSAEQWLMSFNIAGRARGVPYTDGDVLLYDLSEFNWSSNLWFQLGTEDGAGVDLNGLAAATDTPTPTYTPTHTPTATNSNTPTPRYTASFTPTFTFTLPPTPTFTRTPTDTSTPTPTSTYTPTVTATITETPTATETATSTVTMTGTPTATETPTFTATLTPTMTWTVTPMSVVVPDFNHDGRVDEDDLVILMQASWEGNPVYDLDGDGRYTYGDWLRFATCWRRDAPTPTPTPGL